MGLSDENASKLSYIGNKTRVKFNGSCLSLNKSIFHHKKIVNIYIVYKLIPHNSDSTYPTLENCLFGTVKLRMDTDIDNYIYFGNVIGLDRKEFFSTGDDVGRNVTIFGVDMSSSPHIDNKRKYILIIVIGPTRGLGVFGGLGGLMSIH